MHVSASLTMVLTAIVKPESETVSALGHSHRATCVAIARGDTVLQPAWPQTAGGADLRKNLGGPCPPTVAIKTCKVERKGFWAPKMWEIFGD